MSIKPFVLFKFIRAREWNDSTSEDKRFSRSTAIQNAWITRTTTLKTRFDAIYKSPPISKARARAQRPFWPTVLLPFRDWQSYRDWKVSKERSRERSQVRACNCLLNRNRTCCRPWSRLPLMLKIIQFLYYRCITRVRACSGNAYYLPHLCQPEENTSTIAADRRIDVSF